MTIATKHSEAAAAGNEIDNLTKAAAHYKRAAHYFREAASKAEHGHDNAVDHLARHGAAHATHANEHAGAAARSHATEVAECGCSLES